MKPKLLIPILIAIFVVIFITGILVFQGQRKDHPAGNNSASLPAEVSENTTYKDGSYSAFGNYFSPGGEEQISVRISIKNGIIENSDVTSQAQRPNSKRYQQIFIDNYKQFVTGKNIDRVSLDVVSGSSLTPQGFNDALDKIKAQAKA